ncbi:MAG: polyprenol monophosphomannose synthase [Bacteroidota bacterium]|nr:polyprenol monophosphomannose synthase [Bacteroidota bacterium]MDP4218422.1 polyprenol monophosphomannose synthase [Bacteroidota bacterium]MDP4247028.1 polyprenol monophosphomannose synthase [Bacteroidota bacterium]MDP4254889.1 polyprenol monophosphomannose synthase [Bacteroidota bacterium]MDP4260191.1 polyprenol monophosphomannose synthase [Bacteroidota bacterium]
MEKIVIIPTYNENENITIILEAIFQLGQNFHVLVIDDSSPDGTAQIVRELQAKYPSCLFLEERKGKLGLGTAYIHGFKWAVRKDYQFIFEMDADFSHNPKDLQRLYDACKYGGADVAVGSRYVKGGGNVNWPRNRILLSRGGSIYTRLITWMPVQDPTAGFVCYRKEVLETINLDEIRFVGYAFQIEMKFASWKLGFVIKEVPIIFEDRKHGMSKMNKGIVKEGILGVLNLRWHSLFKNYRNRVKKNDVMPLHSFSNEAIAESK